MLENKAEGLLVEWLKPPPLKHFHGDQAGLSSIPRYAISTIRLPILLDKLKQICLNGGLRFTSNHITRQKVFDNLTDYKAR